MKTNIIIPARLESHRYPNKILIKIFGLSMIEHVRRRCLMSEYVSDVYVATPNKEIKNEVESYGGKVIITSHHHENGTSRVAEAIGNIECDNVILVQGDEPLILPDDIDKMCLEINDIHHQKDYYAWNGVSPLEVESDLEDQSIVKCIILNNKIHYCFRKSPSISSFENQLNKFHKLVGLIAFRKQFLIDFNKHKMSSLEALESIEQLRLIENEFTLRPVFFGKNLPSINEPKDLGLVLDLLNTNTTQKSLLNKILD